MRYEKDDNNDEFDDEFRPYFDTDDDSDDDDSEELNEEYLELLERQATLEMAQLELVQSDLNIRVMNMAVEILEKGWFWRFRPLENKLKMIQLTYQMLIESLYKINKENDA